MSQARILVVDIDPVIRSGICSFLVTQGYAVAEAGNIRDAQTLIRKFQPHTVVMDAYLQIGDVSQLLQQAKSAVPRVPVVLLVGESGSGSRLQSVPPGVDELLQKPVALTELHTVLVRLSKASRPARSFAQPSLKPGREVLDPFLGRSAAILRLREICTRVLASESPVLIEGETGVGKGVLAKWIHQNGPRAGRPFLDLNCAGLARELLESELFGHQKGAFTSAVSSKQGLLEVADGGTVFLDEIGDMDLQVQAKLLKVLEERVFRRLGDVRDRAVDVRLISATHRELQDLVRGQRFRGDLYFRVNIVALRLPPLRQRIGDIAPLSEQLLRGIARQCGRPEIQISRSAMASLESYAWPGNIRELRNVLERAALVAESNVLREDHLQFPATSGAAAFKLADDHGTLQQMERAYIHHVLQAERGSVERAARRLGIPRSSLYNKMRRFDIPQGTGRHAPCELPSQAAD